MKNTLVEEVYEYNTSSTFLISEWLHPDLNDFTLSTWGNGGGGGGEGDCKGNGEWGSP
jgi:hypothetical protein